jgi:hypothetical protein
VLHDPVEVGFAVRRVDDQDEPARLDAVDDQVVDDPAALVREQRVLGAAFRHLVDVVREQTLKHRRHLGPLELEAAHVRHVEHPAVLAHREVFRDDALVLHRHLPAGERNHPRTERDMALVERRSKQGLHARPMLMNKRPAARRSG